MALRDKLRFAKSPGTDLIVQRPFGDDGWEDHEAKPVQSGVWLVVKMPKSVKEGGYRAGECDKHTLIEGDEGIDAIKDLYNSIFDRLDGKDRDEADGRYVAIDFYGGERVEALVIGGWQVDVRLAPKPLGPPS